MLLIWKSVDMKGEKNSLYYKLFHWPLGYKKNKGMACFF